METKYKVIKKSLNKIYNIPKDIRHVRGGYEPSGNYEMERELVKYHFIIVDDSDYDRRKMRDTLYGKICKINSGLSDIFEVTGKVRGGKMGYLYSTFDSLTDPNILELKDIGVPVRFDRDLKSKKVLNVMDYIMRTYE